MASLAISLLALLCLLTSAHGFSSLPPAATTTTSRQYFSSYSGFFATCVYALPPQKPGESDMDYIKRLTNPATNLTATIDPPKPKKKGKYQPIEEWDAERTAKGELTWEEKVQFEGQRFGNRVRQNDILQKNINSFF